MSGADWQPGDLALCVRTSRLATVVPGEIFTVVRVCRVAGGLDEGEIGLWFADRVSRASTGGFNSRWFRKIKPHAPDAEDAETIRLLNSKPARVPA